VTIALALGTAVMYGVSDFLGGLLSRHASVWAVALVTQISTTVFVGAAALFLVAGEPTPVDFLWGAVAGVGVGVGTGALYQGLSTGRMGVVAPISAVGAAILPVMVGLLTGERPSVLTWVGIACAMPAIWLVSAAPDPGARGLAGVREGLVAGVGFGVMFAALGQVPEEAGLVPLAVAEAASVPTVILMAVALRRPWSPGGPRLWGATAVSAFAAGGSILFLFATQSGLLAVASVLSSLYPAVTVLMAAVLLRERIGRMQAMGLILALLAVSLVAIG
jgi:drug/metabolite transporter (DMT)-like permease